MKVYSGHRDQKFGFVTYSQHGDDLMIANIFTLLGVTTPSYLDLGAHHPLDISNTALLYSRGSRGVNVEANPHLIEEFRRLRPDDVNANVGVGVKNAIMDFYMYSSTHGRNTFSRAELESYGTKPHNTVPLPVFTINEIVATYCKGVYPDLLTLDIEGLDYEVLATADFSQTRPRLIVTEIRPGDEKAVKTLLEKWGYFCYCRMGENLFFLHTTDKQRVY